MRERRESSEESEQSHNIVCKVLGRCGLGGLRVWRCLCAVGRRHRPGGRCHLGALGSLDQQLERGFHGVGPALVALLAEVECVGHDGPGEGAVGLEEGLSEVER